MSKRNHRFLPQSALVLLCLLPSLCAEVPRPYRTVPRLIWVVDDVERVAAAWQKAGVPHEEDTADRRAARPRFLIRTARFANLRAHWIQPVTGASAFATFLKQRGPGVFSLAYPASSAEDIRAEKDRLSALGVKVLEEGILELGAGRRTPYVFFDTASQGKFVLGLIHDPAPESSAGPTGPQVTQFALTARNLEAVSTYWAKLGFPAFSFTQPGLTDRRYRGQPAEFAMRLGWQRHLSVPFEWIEPLKGPNVYDDHISKHGEGFHHIAFNVPDMDQATARWTALGYPESMSGGWGVKNTPGSGRFAYHDLHPAGGIDIELLWNYATASTAQTPIRFAPDRMETILYGVAYYPEYLPPGRLERDVELMRKAGINLVRVGESTWSSWEPRDGHFELDWMQRVLDCLHRAGIKVVLGTPTYSIPTWLHRKYPDLVVTHNGTAPPLSNPYSPSYPSALTPGYYGPRQNHDLLHPAFRLHAERVIRKILERFKDHPAIIGYQIDNETFPTGVPSRYAMDAFIERLRRKYETPDTINRLWGLVYWGQLVDSWDDLPSRHGILNSGYKLEWENFQHDVVTDYLAWQAKIVNEYKRPAQFVTHDFSGGIHTDIDQWAIARNIDVVAENPYFETQKRLDGRGIWFTGDVGRSLKKTNYLVTETNAQTIGWDSRVQYPPYPGQLRQAVYSHLAAGANMVEYWHWSSLHNGQETYWKGILSHDLEPNRIYAEMSEVAGELKRVGSRLVNLKKDNQVAILFSADSANAISYMPFSDRVNYQSILQQMWNALYDINVEPDFVQAGDGTLAKYKLLLVPPLYSASDAVLQQVSDYVKSGGHVVMAFKSGFTNQHSTVRNVMAPGPLRGAAGFHYQEFTSLAEEVRLTPDVFGVGAENKASVWAEFLIPDTAEVLASLDDPTWRFPAITRNRYGNGTLTYEATFVTDALQREIVRDAILRAGLACADEKLPSTIRVRQGRNNQGQVLRYYFNFSGQEERFAYPHTTGSDLLTGDAVEKGATVKLRPWGVAIVAERSAGK